MNKQYKKQFGASLVEVMVAITMMGILLPTLAGAMLTSQANRPAAIRRLQASSLEREAFEAVRSVREKGWSNVATDGTYHPAISSGSWSLASGSEVINGCTRQIVISSVQRNSSGVIVTSGTIDPSTKYITVTISWNYPYPSSLSGNTYLGRWQNNTSWTQTSQADFNLGTLTNTGSTSSGTVQLLDSPATWQLPSVIGSYNV